MSQLETLVVTPGLLVSIAVTPANPSVPLDTTLQLVATGTYTDGTTGDITQSSMWTSTSASIAVANAPGPAGQVTALSIGTPSVVTATIPSSGITGQATVTAAPAILGDARHHSRDGEPSLGSDAAADGDRHDERRNDGGLHRHGDVDIVGVQRVRADRAIGRRRAGDWRRHRQRDRHGDRSDDGSDDERPRHGVGEYE